MTLWKIRQNILIEIFSKGYTNNVKYFCSWTDALSLYHFLPELWLQSSVLQPLNTDRCLIQGFFLRIPGYGAPSYGAWARLTLLNKNHMIKYSKTQFLGKPKKLHYPFTINILILRILILRGQPETGRTLQPTSRLWRGWKKHQSQAKIKGCLLKLIILYWTLNGYGF